MGHARLSASGTKQWATCPGYPAWMEAHPELDGGSGYHAQLGTAAHTLGERCLREGSEPADYDGRLIEIIDEGSTSILRKGAKWPKQATRIVFEVDQDMIEAVECYVRYIRGRILELGLTMKNVRIEEHVVPLPERDDTGGTGDTIIDAWPDFLEVVDYKHGEGVFVPVEGNMQLRSYGLGALQEAGADDYATVRYTICQPRHRQAPWDGIMSEEVPASELLEWKDFLLQAAARVDSAREMVAEGATLQDLHADGLLSVGEDGSHCTFCELKGGCPAVLAKAQETALVDFHDDPEPIDTPGANRLPSVLPWVPLLDSWLKALMAEAEGTLMAGGKVEGQKLVRKLSKRGWITERRIASEVEGEEATVEAVTPEDIALELVEEFGLDKADIYKEVEPTEPVLLTGPKMEKLLPKKERKRFSDRLLYKPPGGLTMVPEGDKRTAVEVDPASDFEDLED